MGNPLDQRTFDAFGEELIKESISFGTVAKNIASRAMKPVGIIGRRASGFTEGMQQAGQRMLHPIQGLQEGYAHMAPAHRISKSVSGMGFKSPAEAIKVLKPKAEQAKAALEAAKASGDKGAISAARKTLEESTKALGKVEFGGAHLRAPSQTFAEAAKTQGMGAKIRAIAEEASRRGITGQGGPGMILRGRAGDVTKYLPVGEKGQVGLFGAMAVPSIASAKPASPTGEGGALERGGSALGGLGGMVMGSGLGLVPAVGTWLAGEYAGGRLGRIMDRIRSGGNLSQTFTAPSPEQARAQLARIQKHYG